jgi:hypothetical protein
MIHSRTVLHTKKLTKDEKTAWLSRLAGKGLVHKVGGRAGIVDNRGGSWRNARLTQRRGGAEKCERK